MQSLMPLGRALLVGLAILAPGAAVAADLALVIGNHAYRQAPDALSAEADARAVAETLETHGYDVTSVIDLDRDEMRRHVAAFAEQLDDGAADRVVVFYSGHALPANGRRFAGARPCDPRAGPCIRRAVTDAPKPACRTERARGQRMKWSTS